MKLSHPHARHSKARVPIFGAALHNTWRCQLDTVTTPTLPGVAKARYSEQGHHREPPKDIAVGGVRAKYKVAGGRSAQVRRFKGRRQSTWPQVLLPPRLSARQAPRRSWVAGGRADGVLACWWESWYHILKHFLPHLHYFEKALFEDTWFFFM